MKYFIVLFMFVPIFCLGKPINEKYSYKAYSYHGLSFKNRPASEFNNTTIKGSCFYQDWKEGESVVKDIFPDGMVGVEFKNCNIDNLFIPVGNTVVGGTNKKIKEQNDKEDWVLNDSLEPVEPITKEIRLKAKVPMNIDPKKLPKKKFTKGEKDEFDKKYSPNTSINP